DADQPEAAARQRAQIERIQRLRYGDAAGLEALRLAHHRRAIADAFEHDVSSPYPWFAARSRMVSVAGSVRRRATRKASSRSGWVTMTPPAATTRAALAPRRTTVSTS